MQKGQPRYVTVVSCSDVVDGWRERRDERGVIIDVGTDRIVTEDLSMPHLPRLANGSLWVLDSGRGYLCRVDAADGKIERVAFCPGFLGAPLVLAQLRAGRDLALPRQHLPRFGA